MEMPQKALTSSESRLYFKIFDKTQNLMNTLYMDTLCVMELITTLYVCMLSESFRSSTLFSSFPFHLWRLLMDLFSFYSVRPQFFIYMIYIYINQLAGRASMAPRSTCFVKLLSENLFFCVFCVTIKT